MGSLRLIETGQMYRCRVRLDRVPGLMFLGIASEAAARTAKFANEDWWRKTGHGHYVLCSDNMTFSHHSEKDNSYNTIVSYGEKDIVDLTFDSGKMLLTI